MKLYRSITIAVLVCLLSVPTIAQNATELYEEGLKLKKDKKAKEALQKFSAAIAAKPDYTAAMYEAGWCYNDLKDYNAAIDLLRKVRIKWDDISKVYFELGFAFAKIDQYDSASAAFNECLKLKPDYSGAYRELGYIAYEKSNYTEALNQFNKFESVITTPITDYFYWFRKGYVNNATVNYAAAKQALLESLEFKKDYKNTYLEYGFACSKLEEPDSAIYYYKQALILEPGNNTAENSIAQVYRDKKKDCNEAIVWYNKTLEKTPSDKRANYGKAYCMNSLRKFADARIFAQKAIDTDTAYAIAYVELGYALSADNNTASAITALEKAIRLNPNSENAHYYLALTFIRIKQKVKVQKEIAELERLNSKLVASLKEKMKVL